MFKILVLEDDRELKGALCSFLNQNGYEAHGCLRAEEAWDAIYGGAVFDLILPSGISSPGDYTFGNVAGVIKEYVEGKMPAGVEGTFNCADNRDMAETVVRACREGRNGESYILGGDMCNRSCWAP